MKIAFATAQSLRGSTNLGRILPLASTLNQRGHHVHILALNPSSSSMAVSLAPVSQSDLSHQKLPTHLVGTEPFERMNDGKKRLRGILLMLNLLATALRTTRALINLKPNVVIICKPLPANVAGVWLYANLRRYRRQTTARFRLILDADDFELTANKLSSIYQRAVIHWSERKAAEIAHAIVAASPFLSDHFQQLTQNSKPVEIIATGIDTQSLVAERLGTNNKKILAYIGSVSVASGHRVDLLPEMLEKVKIHEPSIHLFIAGYGDNVANLKEEFARRHLSQHVTWHGSFTIDELPAMLAPQSIIIDPVDDSISNRAKSSFRVLLAGNLGLPVVTSNIGIRYELLPEQFHQRFFAEPADIASYVEKLRVLLAQPLSPTERQQLRDRAADYNWEKLSARYQKLFFS